MGLAEVLAEQAARLLTVQMMPRDARSRGGILMPVPGEGLLHPDATSKMQMMPDQGLASRCKMQLDADSVASRYRI